MKNPITRRTEYGSPMRELQRTIDRAFESFMEPFGGGANEDWFEKMSAFSPPVDVDESEGHYVLSFDLPGMKKEDLKVELNENVLKVSGERKKEFEEKEGKEKPKYYERYYGRFSRSFTLPSSVKAEQVKASYEDGVLKVVLPKSEEVKPKLVNIGERHAEIEVKPSKAGKAA